MVKNLFVLFSLFLTIQFCSAQDKKFGIIGGANYSTWRGDLSDFSDYFEGRVSYNLGVFTELRISDAIALSPRIKYSSQGFRDGVGRGNGNEVIIEKESFRFDFLNIPLLMRLGVMEDFNLIAGPQLGFLLNSRSDLFETNLPVDILPQDRDDLPEGLKLDYGIKFGFSYSIKENWFLELSYFHGLSNLTENDVAPNYENRNSVFQLNMAYLIF